MTENPDSSGYSIGVASRRSGVRQETLRAWERRHHALEPGRSAGGHRLYTDGDIERLRLLRLAVEAGHRIGQVAALDHAALEALVRADLEVAPPDGAAPAVRSEAPAPDPSVGRALEAIAALDGPALERVLEEASVELPRTLLVDRLLAPLVDAVGEGYDRGRFRPAHEHLASAVLSAFGQTLRAAFPVAASAPTVVVTTPSHQYHELGAVLAAAVAAAEGWQVVYLGPNLPAEDIVAASHFRGASVVALSVVFPADDRLLGEELRRLRRLLDRRVEIVAGGRATAAYTTVLAEIGARAVPDFASFRRLLGELRDRGAQRAAGAAVRSG